MKQINLSEVRGYPVSGMIRITSVNPYTKMVSVDMGTSASFLTWSQLKETYAIEIMPTAEELVMIERGRLTLQVEEKAREMRSAVSDWLFNEKAR